MKKRKFRVGDKVIIKDGHDFKAKNQNIPAEKLTHGSIPGDGEVGQIMDTHKQFYLVKGEVSGSTLGHEENNLDYVVEEVLLEEVLEAVGRAPYVFERPEYEEGKKLTTKEDYLGKLLDAVALFQKVKQMNEAENEMIDEFIESLFQEIEPEQQQDQNGEPDDQEEKKDQENQGEAQEKKKPQEQDGEETSSSTTPAQPQKDQKSSSTGTKKDTPKKTGMATGKSEAEVVEKLADFKKEMEKLAALKKAMKQPRLDPAGLGVDLAGAVDGEPQEMYTMPEGYDGGKPSGRNKSVRKESTGRLHARSKK
jgi:hypothetical protein